MMRIYLLLLTSTLVFSCSQEKSNKAKDASNDKPSYVPKFAAVVPESVTTPDKIHTDFLGDLDFFDGMPSKETVKKVYDFLDLSRGSEAFLNGIPAASVYGVLEGIKEAGVNPGDLAISKNSWMPGHFT